MGTKSKGNSLPQLSRVVLFLQMMVKTSVRETCVNVSGLYNFILYGIGVIPIQYPWRVRQEFRY